MKKVVIDASGAQLCANQYLSGVGRTTVELIRALEALNDLPFKLELFVQRLRSDRLQRYAFQSRQHCLPLPRYKPISWAKDHFPIVETMTSCDLFHIPHNMSSAYRKSHTILTVHDAMMFEFHEEHLHGKINPDQLARRMEQFGGIITCSDASKERLLRHLKYPMEKISVVPWGYNSEIFRPMPPDAVREALMAKFNLTSPYLLSVSCNIGRKRTPELIQQYLRCTNPDYPYDLVLLWKNVSPNIQALLSCHPQANRVKIFRYAADEELAALYNGCVAMIFPSVYEGFGLPLLEGMACGAPVVTTRETSLPEVAGTAGIYLESLEEDAIGQVLQNFSENKYDLEKHSILGLEQARKFSWSTCAKKTIDVYLELL